MGIIWRVRADTPRLRYVLQVLCEHWLHIPYRIVASPDWGAQAVPTGWRVIGYDGDHSQKADVVLPYSGFIERSGTNFTLPPWNEGGFFPGEGDFGWDLPAMAFYILTAYPLYEWPYGYDEWGNYAWHRAPFYEAAFWKEPFVLKRWYELLQRLDMRFPKPAFHWEMGWDIDHLYLWKGRSGLRWWLGGLRHGDLWKRLKVRFGVAADPYDTIHIITQLFSPEHSRFFFLLSNRHRRDSLVSPFHPELRETIRSLVNQGYSVGIHPSFETRDKPLRLQGEIALLTKFAGQAVRQSRQHYLRYWMPQTFQALAEAGIAEDFTLAFPKRSGFLLGTTLSVPFYRVDIDKVLPLHLWGPALMDRAYIDTFPQEVEGEIQRLFQVVQDTGGRLHFIWHNSTLHFLPQVIFMKRLP
ncbi:MAG: hypothetical protein ABDH66_04900 [Bacteroidia bacterium]